VECLGLNIYHESRNESTAGQIAVGQTTINRVRSEYFPDTVCDVVYQGMHVGNKPVRDGCQFSWYCDGIDDYPRNKGAFMRSKEIANWLLLTEKWIPDITDGSLWYHADYVRPIWSNMRDKTLTIDSHIFYR
tara:strand:- start:140 stop:535 length:396 start_codon:yes stop_codon:yes gene_type:complete